MAITRSIAGRFAVVATIAVVVVLGYRRVRPPAAASTFERASVSLYDDGAPLPDRVVVFHDADGAVLSVTRSGADGRASGPMPRGGMITVAYGKSLRRLVTIAGVEPNDEVVVGERDDDEEKAGETATIARVFLPGPHPSAARYGVSLGVGMNDVTDAGAPLRVPVMTRMLDSERRFGVLGLAFDRDGGAGAYTFVRASASDGGESETRLPAWRSDFRDQRIHLTGIPVGASALTARAAFSILAGDERFDHRSTSTPLTPGIETTLHFAVPPALGATAAYRVELADPGSSDRRVLVRRAAAMPEEVRIHLAEELLPQISHAELAKNRVITWSVTGDATKADATILQLAWPATKEHVWTIVAPPLARATFAVPTLPPELARWGFTPSDPIRAAAALVEASAYASYADVRKKWIGLLGETPDEDATVRLSITGDLTF